MTATITWKINQLDRKTDNGFVTTAHWSCTAVDGEFTGSVYSTASFEGTLTTPYANLTENTVLGWVWESVNKEATEAAVVAQINALKNPVQASGLPW
jgi:hypothetical protein